MVLVKHKEQETWEFSRGHRKIGETCQIAAERELYEETGASAYTIKYLLLLM